MFFLYLVGFIFGWIFFGCVVMAAIDDAEGRILEWAKRNGLWWIPIIWPYMTWIACKKGWFDRNTKV